MGVMSAFGQSHSGWSAGSTSGSVTSRTARIRPARTTSVRASWSTTAPRAVLMSVAPGRIELSSSLLTSPVVVGSSGVWTLNRSLRVNSSGRPTRSTPSSAASSSETYGSCSSTSNSKGRSSSITRRPMSEADRMPTVRR